MTSWFMKNTVIVKIMPVERKKCVSKVTKKWRWKGVEKETVAFYNLTCLSELTFLAPSLQWHKGHAPRLFTSTFLYSLFISPIYLHNMSSFNIVISLSSVFLHSFMLVTLTFITSFLLFKTSKYLYELKGLSVQRTHYEHLEATSRNLTESLQACLNFSFHCEINFLLFYFWLFVFLASLTPPCFFSSSFSLYTVLKSFL